jgi:hypothetical protein
MLTWTLKKFNRGEQRCLWEVGTALSDATSSGGAHGDEGL